MLISSAGIALIKEFEKCILTAYVDQGGKLTIGWGHTGDVINGQVITQQQADALLVHDLQKASAGVTAALGHIATPQNHFDAFAAFALNVGVSGFASSTMLKRYSTGQDCSREFMRWTLVDGRVSAGLGIRRMAERMLFLGRNWQQVI